MIRGSVTVTNRTNTIARSYFCYYTVGTSLFSTRFCIVVGISLNERRDACVCGTLIVSISFRFRCFIEGFPVLSRASIHFRCIQYAYVCISSPALPIKILFRIRFGFVYRTDYA